MRGRTNVGGNGGGDVAVHGDLITYVAGSNISKGDFVQKKLYTPRTSVFSTEQERAFLKLDGYDDIYIIAYKLGNEDTSRYVIGAFRYDVDFEVLNSELVTLDISNKRSYLKDYKQAPCMISTGNKHFVVFDSNKIKLFKYENDEISLVYEESFAYDGFGLIKDGILYAFRTQTMSKLTSSPSSTPYNFYGFGLWMTKYTVNADGTISSIGSTQLITPSASTNYYYNSILGLDIRYEKIVLSYCEITGASTNKPTLRNIALKIENGNCTIVNLESSTISGGYTAIEYKNIVLLNESYVYHKIIGDYAISNVNDGQKIKSETSTTPIYKSCGNDLCFSYEVSSNNVFLRIVHYDDKLVKSQSNRFQINTTTTKIKNIIFENIKDNEYVLSGTRDGYLIKTVFVEDMTILDGGTKDDNVVEPYNGSKAIGFAKTGASVGDEIKVYVPTLN